MVNLKSTPPKCPTSEGGKCIIGCMMTEFGVLSNNQINLTTAGELIKKKAGDKVKECMDVLEVCANKVGVQPSECLAGEFACNCVIDLTNNQINLTTAGNLIKKKAVDKAKESMAVLEICANKVGVQPNECLAGDLACNCVVDVSIRQHRKKSSV
uniref:Uncharacterized protein n=1 Tax=Timema bartmani TaxID=61472 RepID=A0A7R9I5E5_9NEOP|nr:unnamed protein product [Timema bartmani]